jgi:hypothetical protein
LSFFGKRVENEGVGTSFVLFVTFCLKTLKSEEIEQELTEKTEELERCYFAMQS